MSLDGPERLPLNTSPNKALQPTPPKNSGAAELDCVRQTSESLHVVEYPSGRDVEWIAVDRDGRVGVFTTAGVGPMPKVYLTAADRLDRIWNAIRSLPEVSDHELVVTVPRPDDFIAFARRGLYSFDWADVSRARRGETSRYEVQARPRTPIKVDAILWPRDLRDLLGQVTSSLLDFDAASIDVIAALECTAEPAVAADGASPRS